MVDFFFILFISTTTKKGMLSIHYSYRKYSKSIFVVKRSIKLQNCMRRTWKTQHIAQQKRIQSSFEYDFNNWHYCCKNATLLLLLIIHRALLYLWQGFMIRFLCCWFMTLVALERLLGLKYCKKNMKFIILIIHMDVEPCFDIH